MPTEENEQNQPRDHSLDERDHSFDELAKGLASGSLTRRDALKWAGAALVGGLLGSIPGAAWANHRPGHGTPPGQGAPPPGQGGTPPGQGTTTTTPAPTTTTTTTTLAPTTTTTTTTPAPTTTTSTTTTSPPAVCTPNPETPCATACGGAPTPPPGEIPDCVCVSTVEGGAACIEPECGGVCTTGEDCASGICGGVGCCSDEPRCLTPCRTPTSLAAQESNAVWGSR
jgi:hypothetical protein